MAWFGGYEVKATPQSEIFTDDVYGAFVNVIVDCQTEAEFREKASQALMDDFYEILGVENVMQIDLGDTGLPEPENELLKKQLSSGNEVAYGYFQTYPKEGLDA